MSDSSSSANSNSNLAGKSKISKTPSEMHLLKKAQELEEHTAEKTRLLEKKRAFDIARDKANIERNLARDAANEQERLNGLALPFPTTHNASHHFSQRPCALWYVECMCACIYQVV